jgi:hypothetical protein
MAEMVSLAEGIAEVVHCDVNHPSINGMQGSGFNSLLLYHPRSACGADAWVWWPA